MTRLVPGRVLRATSALAVGSVVSGLLAYVFFAMVTRALGAGPAAPVSVLWAWWSLAAAALTFPVQHWISRSVAVHRGERAVRAAAPGLAAIVLLVAAVAGFGSWLARDALFRADGIAFPLFVAGVALGSGLMGVSRGTLSVRRRFGAVAAGLVAENGLRCAAAALLLILGVENPVAYGGCLLAGYLAPVLWPSAFRLDRQGQAGDSPLAFVTGASAGQLLAQVALTGGPVLLAVAGGSPAQVTALFAGLALFRAPYTLALGLVAQLTGQLTRLVVEGRHDALRRLRSGLVLVTLGGAALAALVGGLAGPTAIELVFGEGVRMAGGLTLLLAVGTVFALANLVLTVALLARGRTGRLAVAWLVGAVPATLIFVLAGTGALERVCWTFLVVEAAAFGWLLVEDLSAASRRPGRSTSRTAGPDGAASELRPGTGP